MFTPFTLFRGATLAGIIAASALAIGFVQAKTIRIAEHRQARIDALKTVVSEMEKNTTSRSKSSSIPPRRRII
jgi:hypothetical protein